MKEKKNSVYSNPLLIKFWDNELNEVDPKQVAASERTQKRFWKCPNCGYEWTSSVESRSQSKGKCPCCDSGRAILTGYNDVLTLVPDIYEVFSQEMNPGIDLSALGVSSKKRVKWHCKECGRTWETDIHSRIQCIDGKYSVLKCPHYNTVKRDRNEIKHVSDMPAMMRFWDSKNTVDPHGLPENSDTKVNLLCPDCGYEWSSSPVSFFRNSMKCPACEQHRAVQPGATDLFTLVPELERYYDYDKNPDIDPSLLGVGSREVVHWKCPDCGREWDAPVNTRLIKEDGKYRVKRCRSCYVTDPSRFTPVSSHPELVRFWDFERNTADINLTPSYSETEVKWRCKKCGYQWASSPRNRLRESGCPCCDSGKKIMPGVNDAISKCPDLLNIYEPSLNLGRDLYRTAKYANDNFTWKCKACGYIWDASVRNTVQSSCNCPNCLNRRAIPGTNSLADKRPDLVCMWSDKNNKLPSEVLCNSYYWATWRCSLCGGEFNAYVTDMVNSKECPYCSNEAVLPGFNSFKVKHPELMTEWMYSNNYALCEPDTISDRCDTKVWWTCLNDESHFYAMSPRDRLMYQRRNKEPCPYCKGHRRKKRHYI